MLAWDITRWRRIFKISDGDAERKTKSRNRTSNFESTAETCLETHIPRDGHTLCRENATITHFVKFVTTVFSLRVAVGIINLIVSHGHIAELNKLWRRFHLFIFIVAPSKTADSKAVSVSYQLSTLCSWSHWPRGPVDLKSYWPPKTYTGPQFFSNDVSPSKTVVDI